MSTDRRLDRQTKLIRAQISASKALLDYLDKHLSDIQSLAWDQSRPDSNFPSEMDEAERKALKDQGITPPDPRGPSQADRCRALIASMSGKQGMAKVEDALIGYARSFAKQFAGPAPDDTLRGTLLGYEDFVRDKEGKPVRDEQGRLVKKYVPGSEKDDFRVALNSAAKRRSRAPRTGETAHEPIEAQREAPRERGIDNNLTRDKAS